MGTYIHVVRCYKQPSGVWDVWYHTPESPIDWQSYGYYGWLGGVRNYSAISPIAAKRGMPPDFNQDMVSYIEQESDFGGHSLSWVDVSELLAVDYDQLIEDRRVTIDTGPNSRNGAHTASEGQGTKMPLREFLGPAIVQAIQDLPSQGIERLVFWFD